MRKVRCFHGAREQETLSFFTADPRQDGSGLAGLDTFRYDAIAEPLRQPEHRLHEHEIRTGGEGAICSNAAPELGIQLVSNAPTSAQA